MFTLVEEPKGETLLSAFRALDDAFGTEEFSEGQGVSAISLSLEVDDSKAVELLKNLARRGCIQED